MRNIAFAGLMFSVVTMPALCASYDDLNAGIRFRNQGDWALAISRFDKAIAAKDLTQGQLFIAYLDCAEAHLKLKHFDQAVSDYSNGLALRPDDPEALIGRAAAYESVGKYEGAASDLDTIIARQPKWYCQVNRIWSAFGVPPRSEEAQTIAAKRQAPTALTATDAKCSDFAVNLSIPSDQRILSPHERFLRASSSSCTAGRKCWRSSPRWARSSAR